MGRCDLLPRRGGGSCDRRPHLKPRRPLSLGGGDIFWLALAGLIVVVGPWKASIVFAERTAAFDRALRRRVALTTVAIATVAGLVFILLGEPLVELFHIEDAAFLIAAGLIVVVFSLRLVISDEPAHAAPPDESPGEARKRALRLAVYPLSVPLVITPPGIATLIALGVLAHTSDESVFLVIAAFLIVMAVNLGVFLLESRYEDLLDPAVYQVAGRLLGVLLVGFGVSIGIEGLKILGIV